jgi:small redox-active disulfide protein 2
MKKIQVLSSGCPKCKKLEKNVIAAVENSGKEYEIEKITDITEIISFGVMSTPALVIDGELKFAGKLKSVSEIEKLL